MVLIVQILIELQFYDPLIILFFYAKVIANVVMQLFFSAFQPLVGYISLVMGHYIHRYSHKGQIPSFLVIKGYNQRFYLRTFSLCLQELAYLLFILLINGVIVIKVHHLCVKYILFLYNPLMHRFFFRLSLGSFLRFHHY